MSKKQNLYIGMGGQLAVMSEFLLRGYNVAIPQVDVGNDIFVVRDDNGNLSRIQVKSSVAKVSKKGYSASFAVGRAQLATPVQPEVHYVFAVRRGEAWTDFLVIDRSVLFREHDVHGVGSYSEKSKSVVFYFAFRTDAVTCSKRSFQTYRGNWSNWAVIRH